MHSTVPLVTERRRAAARAVGGRGASGATIACDRGGGGRLACGLLV